MKKKLHVLRELTPDYETAGKDRQGTVVFGSASQGTARNGAAGKANHPSLFISANGKTGRSINTSIAYTCQPTKACADYCYGMEGRLRYPAALASQVRNTEFFEKASEVELLREARRVGQRVLKRQKFIRMFGVGDLQKGSAFFVTCLARENPKLAVWVSTRKLQIAEVLPELPNLHVMLSCDSTTTAAKLEHTRDLIRRRDGQYFAAWVRRSANEVVPKWVSVVFEEHHIGGGRATWEPEARACPATVRGGVAHDGACAKCRFCFDASKRERGTALSQVRKK